MQDRTAKPAPRRIIGKRALAVFTPQPAACFFNGGVEPHLDDMLSDPIIAMVMQRDRVSPDEVMSVMRAAARAI
ncbi:MAG: hypothetical protein K1X51_11945 [Rhodospirillaceae bacterium]|nr:hypothetical protein [Rhodospirillaceae bacterium]